MEKSQNYKRSKRLYDDITRITEKYYGLKIFIYNDEGECHSLITNNPSVKNILVMVNINLIHILCMINIIKYSLY